MSQLRPGTPLALLLPLLGAATLSGCGQSGVAMPTWTPSASCATPTSALVDQPCPGLAAATVRPTHLQAVHPQDGGRTLVLSYFAGGDVNGVPYSYLDHVQVDPTPSTVTVTVYLSTPVVPWSCVDDGGGQPHTTSVHLLDPVGSRTVDDGGTGALAPYPR
jgi:hypothetical protein